MKRTQKFRELYLFPSSGGKVSVQLYSLEEAILSHYDRFRTLGD